MKRSIPKGFPLFKHGTRYQRWCKKVRGKHHYFGSVAADPTGEKALAEWLDVKDTLLAGRKPRRLGGPDLAYICNAFLDAKKRALDAGELKAVMLSDYLRTCQQMANAFGAHRQVSDLVSDDFATFRAALAKRYGTYGLAKAIQMTRTIFKHAYEAELIETPVRFGPEFKKPSAKAARLARAASGDRLLTKAEIHKALAIASEPMRAMILLGLNCGMGNTDCAELKRDAIDLETGTLNYARPKSGVQRRAVLWAETMTALKAAMACRPTPKNPDHAGLVFITKRGNPWIQFRLREDKPGVGVESIRLEFGKILVAIGVKRPGTGFYSLRHLYRSVVDELPDRPAIDLTMGHEVANDMRAHYVQRISDDRLRAVADHMHRWLFGVEKTED